MSISLLQDPCCVDQQPLSSCQTHIEHKISAGFPSPAQDYIQDSLDFNDYLVAHKAATFVFTVKGDSMQGVGILDGDKVVVDRSISYQHNHIVIAVIDGEYTLKRLYCHAGRVELHPENIKYKSIVLIEGQELIIWGVVVGVVRKIRP